MHLKHILLALIFSFFVLVILLGKSLLYNTQDFNKGVYIDDVFLPCLEYNDDIFVSITMLDNYGFDLMFENNNIYIERDFNEKIVGDNDVIYYNSGLYSSDVNVYTVVNGNAFKSESIRLDDMVFISFGSLFRFGNKEYKNKKVNLILKDNLGEKITIEL